jgi:hypothetical protein
MKIWRFYMSSGLAGVFLRMTGSHDFSVGRHDLNPQKSPLLLQFQSAVRLERTQNQPSLVGETSTLLARMVPRAWWR